MDIYNEFAKVYDTFMGDTPYEQWAEFLLKIAAKHQVTPKII